MNRAFSKMTNNSEKLTLTMVVVNSNKRRQTRLSTCTTLVIGACIALFVVAFVGTENILGEPCFCASFHSQSEPCPSAAVIATEGSSVIPQEQDEVKPDVIEQEVKRQPEITGIVPTVPDGAVAPSLRTTVLQLLESLPNNTTQRELSRAIVRTNDQGIITLTTQGGASKLPRLLDLAGRWLGPISCGFYITSTEHLDELLSFVARNEIIQRFVSFHFLIEQPQLPVQVNRHPINRLRNLALQSAETDYVFINDVDFMPPVGSHDAIVPRVADLQPKTFLVLPAFERFGAEKKGPGQFVNDVNMVPSDKKQLIEAVDKKEKEVAPFHEYFKAGHGPSDYKKWYTATDLYDISYDYLFEPYVIVHKHGLPQFFPTFRGFGFNKMCFYMEAFYMGGFTYKVLPDQFVVHMNHGGRKGRNDKGGDSKYIRDDFRTYLTNIYGVNRLELQKWK